MRVGPRHPGVPAPAAIHRGEQLGLGQLVRRVDQEVVDRARLGGVHLHRQDVDPFSARLAVSTERNPGRSSTVARTRHSAMTAPLRQLPPRSAQDRWRHGQVQPVAQDTAAAFTSCATRSTSVAWNAAAGRPSAVVRATSNTMPARPNGATAYLVPSWPSRARGRSGVTSGTGSGSGACQLV